MEHNERVDRESSDEVDVPQDVKDSLSRLGTLTFQQRRMINDGEILSVLEQFVAGHKSFDWMFVCGTIGFGANFVFGLPIGQVNWISGLIAVSLFVFHRLQTSKIDEVTQVVRQFADSQGHRVPSRETQLLTELRLNYTLTYQQNKQLKAGEVVEVARVLARGVRRHGWMHLALMLFCALPPLIKFVGDYYRVFGGTDSVTLQLFFSLAHGLLLLGSGGFVARTQFNKARKLDELMGLHPADEAALKIAAPTASDNDSPYRSPQFR